MPDWIELSANNGIERAKIHVLDIEAVDGKQAKNEEIKLAVPSAMNS